MSREETERQLAEEYAAYLVLCSQEGTHPVNYMNWATSKKFNEKLAKGERAFDRRGIARDT